jgi:DNA invertase Pin-like site-specific DNA recombinase
MAEGRFIAYYRVSTKRQGDSGLGLEAQQHAVTEYLNGGAWQLLGSFTEVESGKVDERPELAKAFAACRVKNATLVIAKLDRLSRNAHFLLGLKDAGVRFVCADMPQANEFTIGILALVAQNEREAISRRTREALQAAKRRGVKLGTPGNLTAAARALGAPRGNAAKTAKAAQRAADILPMIRDIHAEIGASASLEAIAAELNGRGVLAPRGGKWQSTQVWRLLKQERAA